MSLDTGTANKTCSLLPFKGHDRHKVASVWSSLEQKQCGHEFLIQPLVDYLRHNPSSGCPLCRTKIVLIRDLGASNSDSDTNTIGFKYGKQQYLISMPPWSSRYFWSMGPNTFQASIQSVLNVTRIKILSQGHIVYPSSEADAAVSLQLWQLWQSHKTLVVMGTPQETSSSSLFLPLRSIWNVMSRSTSILMGALRAVARFLISQLWLVWNADVSIFRWLKRQHLHGTRNE
jgi:hypothetical protein